MSNRNTNHRMKLKHYVELHTGGSITSFLKKVGLSRQLWAYHGYNLNYVRPEVIDAICKELKISKDKFTKEILTP